MLSSREAERLTVNCEQGERETEGEREVGKMGVGRERSLSGPCFSNYQIRKHEGDTHAQ